MSIAGLAGALESLGHPVEVVRPNLPLTGPMGRVPFNLLLPLRVRGRQADAVVGFDLDGLLVPRVEGRPFIVCLKGIAADEARFERGLPRLERSLVARAEGWSARRASLVVVPSRYSARVAIEEYGLDPRRVAVVPEGVELDRFTRLSREEPAPGPATILTVARQYPRKNTRRLLDALPDIVGVHPEARLRVVGGGPELPGLRRRARELGLGDRATFLGPISDDALIEEYARAHCFCLPSRQEGFGIVFLEAMAAGLPVVAGRAGAVPEVVSDGETGILVDPDDPEALAGAVCRILGDPSLGRTMGRAGRRRARDFTLRKSGEAFLAATRMTIDRT